MNLDVVKYNNYLLNQQEIKEKKTILKSKPLSLIFTINTDCQLACIMCPVKKSKPVSVDFDYVKQFMDFCGKEAVSVQWIGGEPLLHPDFEKFITAADNVNLLQTVTTNGLLLNGTVAEKLIKYNADIVISIDGAKKTVYESIRRGGNFELLINNIKFVNELRKKYGHTGHFGINFCILKQNAGNIVDIVEFAKKYNFKGVNFILPYDTDKSIAANIDEKFKKDFLTAEKKAKEYKIEIIGWSPFVEDIHFKDFSDFNNNKMICYSPFCNFGINPDGRIDVCICMDLSFTEKQEVKNLDEIWNDKQVQKYRQNIYNNILPSQICEKCSGIGLRHFYHPQVVSRLNDIKNIN